MAEDTQEAARTARPGREPASCGGCAARWTGTGRAHCAAKGCHRTFSTASLFDQHRSAEGERGSCLDPEELTHGKTGARLMFLRDGLWCGPQMSEEVKARLFGSGDAA